MSGGAYGVSSPTVTLCLQSTARRAGMVPDVDYRLLELLDRWQGAVAPGR